MGDILFVTWDGGGNVPPALGIAAELTRRRHSVRFLGHPQQRERIESAGFAFQPFVRARPFSPVDPVPGMKGAIRYITQVFTNPRIGDDLLIATREREPDLVVIDQLLFGALRAADLAGLRRATLVHSLCGQQFKQWSSGLPRLLLRLRGLRAMDLWLRSDLVLAATLPELEPPTSLPPHVRFTGPVWQEPHPQPASPTAAEPLVLVSLSTIYQDGQQRALQAILDAVADLPVRALVSTGSFIDPASLRVPANAEARRFVPHADVMPRASLVISHGGHSTAMAALAHDLPLVIMPMLEIGDQPWVGRALERQGAARMLRKTASPERIRTAIQDLLRDERPREAARALGAKIRTRDGAIEAADQLEHTLALTPA